MVAATIAVIVFGTVLHFAALRTMGRRRPIGDEETYLERGRSNDPYAPRIFVRPPVLPWLAHVCTGISDSHENGRADDRLRVMMTVASVATLALTALAGWRSGGAWVSLVGALLLAVHPERLVLGCHIWPDVLLAATAAALMVVSTFPTDLPTAIAAGGLCAFGVMTRLDFLVVPPLVLAGWGVSNGPLSIIEVAAVLTPPLAALVLLSLYNLRRYGVPLPDTTWAFNLMVALAETRFDRDERFEIERTIAEASERWNGLTPIEGAKRGLQTLGRILRTPVLFVRGLARRLLILIGPDTFVRQKLLPRDAAYPDLGAGRRDCLEKVLVVATPLLMTVVLIGAVMRRNLPESPLWPSVGLAAAAVALHTRTRYRLTILPALSLIAAGNLAVVPSLIRNPLTGGLVLLAGAVVYSALIRIRCSDELSALGTSSTLNRSERPSQRPG